MPYKDPNKQAASQREHYERNKEAFNVRHVTKRDKLKDWFEEYKKQCKCAKCGFNYHIALDFHHVNPEEKKFTLARAVVNCKTKADVQAEIRKCVVLCANCHRIFHYLQPLFNLKIEDWVKPDFKLV